MVSENDTATYLSPITEHITAPHLREKNIIITRLFLIRVESQNTYQLGFPTYWVISSTKLLRLLRISLTGLSCQLGNLTNWVVPRNGLPHQLGYAVN